MKEAVSIIIIMDLKKPKMNRTELAKALAEKTNLNSEKAEQLIGSFCDAISKALINDQKVVYSNFGTFYKVHYPSKVILHPKLGAAKKMIMLPTDAVKWMPSENIKAMVDSGIELENATAHGARKMTLAQLERKVKSMPKEKNDEVNPELNPEDTEETDDIPVNTESKKMDEEEVSIPIKIFSKSKKSEPENKKEETSVNIYEELMGDGSKYESTFNDAIRVHRKKSSIIGRVFGRNENEPKEKPEVNSQNDQAKPEDDNVPVTNSEKISLSGAGIFENTHATLPQPGISLTNPNDPIQDPSAKADTSTISASNQVQTLASNLPTDSEPEPFNSSLSLSDPKSSFAAPDSSKDLLPEKDITPFGTQSINKIDVSYLDLSKITIPKETLQIIPEKLARQYKIVPVENKPEELVVAMVDPQDLEARELIKKIVGKNVTIKLSTEDDINRVLDQYSGFENELKEAIETADDENKATRVDEQAEDDKNSMLELVSDNAPAARIVTSLLRRAIRDKASDIHIEPSEKEVEVRFRQDGILRKTASLPKDVQSSVISRIKILSDLKIDEQRLPQDGRFSINYENRKIDFRVSTMPVANGEKVVMRVLDKMTGILSIEQLGIRGQGFEVLKASMERTHGMTLVTGPTGSGKTTTLYALIDSLFSEGVNICTLEDPIEYRMPGINQSQVNAEINYTFASGLRSLVRQDPDIIMIGEIRDAETAEMAVHAALTGHIVLSTLHTNDAAGAAPRLIDMGVEPFLLTSSINAIIGQRLAREICKECKEELKVADAELEQIKAEISKMPEAEQKKLKGKELKFFHGKGCKSCGNTGYKGRIGLYEILGISEPVKEMILAKESSFKIKERAIQEGMVTMLQDGILKALDGITTIEEIWRTTKE